LVVTYRPDSSNVFPITLEQSIDGKLFRERLLQDLIFFFGPAKDQELILVINATILRRSNESIVMAIKRAILVAQEDPTKKEEK